MKPLRALSISLFLLLASNQAKSQDMYHSVGIGVLSGIFYLDYDGPTVDYSGLVSVDAPGVFYRGNLAISDKLAISANPMIGFAFSGNSRTGGELVFGVELPVNAELYFGDLESNMFFLGAGATYGFVTDTYDGGGILGPQIAVGGQANIQDHIVGGRVSMAYGLNKVNLGSGYEVHQDRKMLLSLGLFYNFSAY